jgi:two-component system, LuxR family, response regulator FixJ
MLLTKPVVYVVDDDKGARDSLVWLLGSVNLLVKPFENGEEFLKAYSEDQPGCLVLDLRLPGASGLTILEKLANRPIHPPVVLITAYGSVATTARAMRAGAVHVLEKPYDDQEFLDAVHEAITRDAKNRDDLERRTSASRRLCHLTSREREVLDLMIQGKANKVMARELDVTQKNIEFHRANVMRKMEVDSIAELIRFVIPVIETELR